MEVKKSAGKVAWFHFDELFRTAMSSIDYLAIVKEFSTVFIHDLPKFRNMAMREEARRFITFIDILYDAKVCQ